MTEEREDQEYVIGYSMAKYQVLKDPNHNPVIFRTTENGNFSVMRFLSLRTNPPYALGDGCFATYKAAAQYANRFIYNPLAYKIFCNGVLVFITNRRLRALAYQDFLQANYAGRIEIQEEKLTSVVQQRHILSGLRRQPKLVYT